MNIAIFYYSLTNHSKTFAEGLSNKISCDIFRLKTQKYIPKTDLFKHIYCSFIAGLEKKHPLEDISFNSEDYDLIILITPVWFGKLPPAYNTFFKENTINCEIIMVYSCFIAFDYLTDYIENKYLKGDGYISHSMVIYDQKPKSYRQVTKKIIDYLDQNRFSVDSREIHYNLLYQ